jgi:glucose-6-phosphate isomerase
VWGEIGSNGQHAFFQLLHQGGWLVPSDFIASAHSDYPLPGHQAPLMANFLAQSAALAFGKTEAEARAELQAAGVPADRSPRCCRTRCSPATSRPPPAAAPQPLPPGHAAGAVRAQGVRAGRGVGINSFDQWGVELGKQLAGRLLPALCGEVGTEGLDPSTGP